MERIYYKKQKTAIITLVVKKKAMNIILKTGILKEHANNKYRDFSEEEKKAKREYQRNRYRNMKEKTSQESIKRLKF